MDLSDAPAGCGDALGALTSLHELALAVLNPQRWDNYSTANFGVIGTALQCLTQLTRLDVEPTTTDMHGAGRNHSFGPCLEAPSCVQALPASLKQLRMCRDWRKGPPGAADVFSLEHLTNLSALQLRRIRVGTVLPAALESLRLPDCGSIEPLVVDKLQHVEELLITRLSADTTNLSDALTCLQGCPQIRELHLGIDQVRQDCEPLQFVKGLAKVPLVELSMLAPTYCMFKALNCNVGSLTQLTHLSLGCKGWRGPVVKQPATTLRQLTVLSELLIFDCVCGDAKPGVSAGCADWGLVCQAVVALRDLRELTMRSCNLGDAGLASATQLTRLQLRRCRVNLESQAVLAAGLKHMLSMYLYVCNV